MVTTDSNIHLSVSIKISIRQLFHSLPYSLSTLVVITNKIWFWVKRMTYFLRDMDPVYRIRPVRIVDGVLWLQ